MDGFESIFRDILGVFSNYTIKGDFETIFTDFLGVFKFICTKCGQLQCAQNSGQNLPKIAQWQKRFATFL